MTAIAASYHDRVNVLQGMMPKDASPFDRPEWFALLAERKPPLLALASDGEQMALLDELAQLGMELDLGRTLMLGQRPRTMLLWKSLPDLFVMRTSVVHSRLMSKKMFWAYSF